MRRLLVIAFLAGSSLQAQESRALIGLPGRTDKVPIEENTMPFTIDAPMRKTYAAVRAAFDALGLTMDVADSTKGLVGIMTTHAQRMFAGMRTSRILDCGDNSMTGPNADTYRITLAFLALLDRVDDTHTKLRVGLAAGATPSSGSRTEGVSCGSTGALEQKFADLVNAKLK